MTVVGGTDVGVRACADEAPVVCPGEGRQRDDLMAVCTCLCVCVYFVLSE
jgi:hypothetical protein